jgi:hypothetical protein
MSTGAFHFICPFEHIHDDERCHLGGSFGDHNVAFFVRIAVIENIFILNVEHRTPNFQRPMMMALRYICFKQAIHAEDVN